jgi:hypothetical protein
VQIVLGSDTDGTWIVAYRPCPDCGRFTLELFRGTTIPDGSGGFTFYPDLSWTAHPRSTFRAPVPESVPADLKPTYLEACLVVRDSAAASAALSRRCLQHLLRQYAKVKPSNLDGEIQELLDRHELPSHLAGAVDAVRQLGNFAAHPIKSKSTGEIVDVEPGEAEWNLDTLESLFDFYFESPRQMAERRAALNKKLVDAGKPELK